MEDKYAVATLGVVGIIALWSATGMISVSDNLGDEVLLLIIVILVHTKSTLKNITHHLHGCQYWR